MKKHFMPNFETGVLTTYKSEVNFKKRVKIDPCRFGDDFEIFGKFREHFIWNFKRGISTNDMVRLFKRCEIDGRFFREALFFSL